MVSRTQLNRQIASSTGISIHIIDRIGVRLQEAGLIKSGGRGPYAPKMDHKDFTTILLAVMGSDNTNRAAKVVKNYSELKSERGDRLIDVLVDVFFNPGIAEHIEKLTVCRSYPEVIVHFNRREIKFKSEKGDLDQKKIPDQKPGLRIDATISGDIIYNCSAVLSSV